MASWGDGSGGWASPDDRSDPPSPPPQSPPPGYPPQQPPPPPGYYPPQQPAPPPGYTPGGGYGVPPGYPQGPYGYPYATQKTDGAAIGALLCAVLSWLTCFPVLAIVALPLASAARKRIALSGGTMTGEKLLAPAKWIAIAHIVVSALVIGSLVIALIGEIASDPEPTPEQFQLRVLMPAAWRA